MGYTGTGNEDTPINFSNSPNWSSIEGPSTTKLTSYITELMAMDLGAGGSSPEPHYYTVTYQDYVDPSDSPPGGWKVPPNEIIPCRGYNAVNCSLAVRVRQLLFKEAQDQGAFTGGSGYENSNTEFQYGTDTAWGVTTNGTYNQVYAAHTDLNVPSPSANVINSTNASFGVSPSLFYSSDQVKSPGPFKMSDWRGAANFVIEVITTDSNDAYGDLESITVNYIISYGKKMENGSGPIHLGGSPTNPTVVDDGFNE